MVPTPPFVAAATQNMGKMTTQQLPKSEMLFLGKGNPPLGTTGGGGEILFLSYDVTICGTDIYVILFQEMI